MTEIAALIERACAASGLPRKTLAKRAGIAPETLSRMCRRGTGDFATVSKIARLAGVPLHDSRSVQQQQASYGAAQAGHEDHDTRSLVMHAVIAGRLLANPALVAERVLPNIQRFKAIHEGGGSTSLLEQWERAALEGAAALLRLCTDPSESGKHLRQASPLTGLLLPGERRQIYETFAA